MKYVVLEKTKSKLDRPHTNGIEVGSRELHGFLEKNALQVGKQLILYDRFLRPYCWTSIVLSFTKTEIETKNSTYKINYQQHCEDCNESFFNNVVVNEEHCCPYCFSINIKQV